MSEAPPDSRRFKLIPEEDLTPEQRKLVDAIRSGARSQLKNSGATRPGPIGGPFNVWLRSPDVGNIVQALGEAIRFRTSIPAKLNEMAIIMTARFWTSQYEWHSHLKLALEKGLDPEIGKAIAENRRPAKMDADETLVYEFTKELHETKNISDAMFKRAVDRFGERGVVDLIILSGFYTLVSMCLNVDRTPLPDGLPPPLK